MALPAKQQEQLHGFLGSLPSNVAARLARAVEADKNAGGSTLPHEFLLEALRPLVRNAPQSHLPIQTLLEKAPRDILAALPPHKIGGFGMGAKPLDLSGVPDPECRVRAIHHAALLADAGPLAAAAGLDERFGAAMERLRAALRRTAEDLIRELRAAKPETRFSAEQYLSMTLDLCALLLDSEEAERLGTRAKAATAI